MNLEIEADVALARLCLAHLGLLGAMRDGSAEVHGGGDRGLWAEKTNRAADNIVALNALEEELASQHSAGVPPGIARLSSEFGRAVDAGPVSIFNPAISTDVR